MEKFESNIFEKVDGYKQRKSNIGNCALSSFSLLFSTPPDRLFLLESNMNIPTQINYEKSNPKFPPPFPKSSNICSTLFTISEFHSPKKLLFFFLIDELYSRCQFHLITISEFQTRKFLLFIINKEYSSCCPRIVYRTFMIPTCLSQGWEFLNAF